MKWYLSGLELETIWEVTDGMEHYTGQYFFVY